MIDWYYLSANSLWILALALALATLGFARWEARIRVTKLKEVLNYPRWQISLYVAGVLFSGGLVATSDAFWEQVLTSILGMVFLIQLIFAVISMRKNEL